MKKEELKIFIESVNQDELKEFYGKNGFKETLSHYNLSNGNLREVIKLFNLVRTKEQIIDSQKKTLASKPNSLENKIKQLQENIPINVLIDYYDNQNHSIDESCAYFGISKRDFIQLLKSYNYHKSAESHIEKVKQSKLDKYGNCNYNNRDKAKETCINKYGVENTFQADEIKDRIANTNLEKYGVSHAMRNKSVSNKMLDTKIKNYGSIEKAYLLAREKSINTIIDKYGSIDNLNKIVSEKMKETKLNKYGNPNYRDINKTKETCLEKYGVEFPCMRVEARKAGSNNSKPNLLFAEKLDSLGIQYDREFTLCGYSYDFKVGNILIEINPTSTHNTTWNPYGNSISIDYHKNKTKVANDNGFRCVHIFDWDNIDLIANSLVKKTKIYARDCIIKEVDSIDTDCFINANHFQGTCKGQTIRLGLYCNEELLQIMTFGKPRYNKNFQYELLRLCSKIGYSITGGSEKLFNNFIKTYKVESIISYCDNSKFTGDVYKKLGFSLNRAPKPSKHWYNIKTKVHITDNLLRQRGYDQLFGTSYGKNSNNNELMLSNGFVEVFDCGQSTYCLNNSRDYLSNER